MSNQGRKISVGVVGASGYAGLELLKILISQTHVSIVMILSEHYEGTHLSDYAPYFQGKCDLVFERFDAGQCARKCDVVFFATPHGVTMRYAKLLYDSGVKIIDLSGDYRLSADEYNRYYGHIHEDGESLNKWVYGMGEVFRQQICSASYVANPGCYATSVLLALFPIYERYNPLSVICDVKSGVSGRGKKLVEGSLFIECNENMLAYKLEDHQHIPEIESAIENYSGKRPSIVFTPHLIPMDRGILSTIYVIFDQFPDIDAKNLRLYYKQFYQASRWVKILNEGVLPQTKHVTHTNECHINVSVNNKTKTIKIISVIDNLVKGASGNAFQNFNLMYGF